MGTVGGGLHRFEDLKGGRVRITDSGSDDIQGGKPIRTAPDTRWTETVAFRAVIVAYGKLLPLRKPSPFGEPDMIRSLLKQSAGTGLCRLDINY